MNIPINVCLYSYAQSARGDVKSKCVWYLTSARGNSSRSLTRLIMSCNICS